MATGYHYVMQAFPLLRAVTTMEVASLPVAIGNNRAMLVFWSPTRAVLLATREADTLPERMPASTEGEEDFGSCACAVH